MNSFRCLLTCCLVSILATGCQTGPNPNQFFGNWPEGTSPREIGKRVAENFAARQFRFQTAQYANGNNSATSPVIYPEVCAWYGAFTFAETTKDDALRDKLIAKFGIFSTPEGAAHISATNAVDYHIFGAVPLEVYMLTKSEGYRTLGVSFADRQWANPTADGLPGNGEARFWVDDLYMLPLVEMQAYRATQEAHRQSGKGASVTVAKTSKPAAAKAKK